MAQDLLTTIHNAPTLDKLAILERNIRKGEASTLEIDAAIEGKYAEFGREMVAAKTGLPLDDLTPAEHKIVNAIGRYVGLQKRDGKGASRTFQLLARRGLIDSAEVTVARSRVTQGFEVLDQAEMRGLSFEQIIVDHADEFSARALWYARNTLRLGNESPKAPADVGTLTQQRTGKLLDWLTARAARHGGMLSGYTNADVGKLLGFDDLSRHGRVLGNIQSRIDFACYVEGAPPLGLCVIEHFANAWSQDARRWRFPVTQMRAAAQSFEWHATILDAIRATSRTLPGQAAIPWRKELLDGEERVRRWAESLEANLSVPALPAETPKLPSIAETERNLLKRRPEVRERASKIIERGTIGQRLKRAHGFKCQLCEAIGVEPVGFLKADGDPYVEAHHATPVSELEIGSLSAGNIMILCANHHRQMHYGRTRIERTGDMFTIDLDGRTVTIKRFAVDD